MDFMLGQIFQFAGNYPPTGSMFCDGSVLKIVQYQALYALLGQTYGGDGKTTFALPDLRGRVPIGFGTLSGQSVSYAMGAKDGSESVILTTQQLPSHQHRLNVSNTRGNAANPQGNVFGAFTANSIYVDSAPNTLTNPAWMAAAGAAEGHPNMMPFVAINYCIAIVGYFPVRQ